MTVIEPLVALYPRRTAARCRCAAPAARCSSTGASSSASRSRARSTVQLGDYALSTDRASYEADRDLVIAPGRRAHHRRRSRPARAAHGSRRRRSSACAWREQMRAACSRTHLRPIAPMRFLLAGPRPAGGASAAPPCERTGRAAPAAAARRPARQLLARRQRGPVHVEADEMEFDYKTDGAHLSRQRRRHPGGHDPAHRHACASRWTEGRTAARQGSRRRGRRADRQGRAPRHRRSRRVRRRGAHGDAERPGARCSDGPNEVAGEQVVVYLDEQRSVVEGGHERVRAVLYPPQPSAETARPRTAMATDGQRAARRPAARRGDHQAPRRARHPRRRHRRGAGRRGRRPARPQRRRQDHHLLLRRRPAAARRRQRARSTAPTSPASRCTAAPASASATCRRSRRCSASSRSRRTSWPSSKPCRSRTRSAASAWPSCSRSSASPIWPRAPPTRCPAASAGGSRSRRALVTSPTFMLLDEPFAGIDPIAVLDIQTIITQLRERGIGILITDHNVRETLGICDRAYILNGGVILEEGTPEVIAASRRARELYLGEALQPIGRSRHGARNQTLSTARPAAGHDPPAAAGDQDPAGVARRAGAAGRRGAGGEPGPRGGPRRTSASRPGGGAAAHRGAARDRRRGRPTEWPEAAAQRETTNEVEPENGLNDDRLEGVPRQLQQRLARLVGDARPTTTTRSGRASRTRWCAPSRSPSTSSGSCR